MTLLENLSGARRLRHAGRQLVVGPCCTHDARWSQEDSTLHAGKRQAAGSSGPQASAQDLWGQTARDIDNARILNIKEKTLRWKLKGAHIPGRENRGKFRKFVG